MMGWKAPSLVFWTLVGAPLTLAAQESPDARALLSAQAEAMRRLASLEGIWTGSAWTILPSGERQELTQTERVGPFLGGSLRVIEGRGFDADGRLAFNAFAIISYDPQTERYSMRSYARGRSGDFELAPTGDGYTWEIPAGPLTIRYAAVITGDTWSETGDRIMPGRDTVRFFEMHLTRIGDTDWPTAGAVAPPPGS
jgi:hypothetical protein